MHSTRRDFLKLTGVTAASLSLPLFHYALSAKASDPKPAKLTDWSDLYRQQWGWDKVVRGSHGWVNCRSACNWDIYVKDGLVIREEQTANYEASEAGVPDFNPRGCQKGACYTHVMYGPSRLTVPLKRAGERGEGKWQAISWDQALEEIAEKLVDIIDRHGGESIVQDLGPHFDMGSTTISRYRFYEYLGASSPDDWGEIGDLNMGATLTFGFPHVGGSSDEWFLSDFLVVWMMNPSVTQMADAHFLFEAKYKGAKLVVIDPVFSATAVHANTWIPIKPGTDAALGLATARYIWHNGFIDEAYVKEQTDFPVLVRLDTGRFLRESDFDKEGRDNLLYVWDPRQDQPVPAPGCEGNTDNFKLVEEGLDPPIEGSFNITMPDGSKLGLVTVGSLVKEHLDSWTIDKAAEVTGLSADAIEQFASGFAKAERPMVLSSWGSNRYLHSDHFNRSKILCLALKGAIGKKGAGYHSTGWFGMSAAANLIGTEHLGARGAVDSVRGLFNGFMFRWAVDLVAGRKSIDDFWRDATQDFLLAGCNTNSASQNYEYGGIKDVLAKEQDHLYPRPLKDYIAQSQNEDWMPLYPRNNPQEKSKKQSPKAWLSGGSNVLRRSNMTDQMLNELWPELELVVGVNQKMSFTGMNADYLLPAAGYYEKPGIKYTIAYIPYLHYCNAAVKPVGKSKDEWEIYWLLAQAIEKAAKKRQIDFVEGCGKGKVNLAEMGQVFSFHGEIGPDDAEKLNDYIVTNSKVAERIDLKQLKRDGVAKYSNAGDVGIQEQLYNREWQGEGVLQALTSFYKDKWHWPTLTGRQQFYIDHPWFIEAGESLASHIDSPKAGGNYPFQLISCHSRWSIHSVWRDTPLLLRLQRGEPCIYVNPGQATELGLVDGGWSQLFNDYGEVNMRVKISTMVRPGVAYHFHAWEPYQFPKHRSYKALTPGLMNPMHFAGGEGHLGWRFANFEPGTAVQDTRVGLRPLTDVDSAS